MTLSFLLILFILFGSTISQSSGSASTSTPTAALTCRDLLLIDVGRHVSDPSEKDFLSKVIEKVSLKTLIHRAPKMECTFSNFLRHYEDLAQDRVGELHYIRSDEDIDYSCVVSNTFLVASKYRKMQPGYAYFLDDNILVRRFETYDMYDLVNVRQIFNGVCVKDGSVRNISVLDVVNEEKCKIEVARPTFNRRCEDRCSLGSERFHKTSAGCCECKSTLKGQKKWSDTKSRFDELFGVEFSETYDSRPMDYIKDLFTTAVGLGLIADVLAMASFSSGDFTVWGISIVLSVFSIFTGGMPAIIRSFLRMVMTYPGSSDTGGPGTRAVIGSYITGAILMMSLRIYANAYTLLVATVWYFAMLFVIAAVSKWKMQGKHHIYLAVFLMSSLTDGLVQDMDILVGYNGKSLILCVLYGLSSPLRSTGFFTTNVVKTTEDIMKVMPYWVERSLGANSSFAVMLLVTTWTFIYFMLIRAGMSRVSLVWRGTGRGTYMNWMAQNMVEIPSLSGFREIALYLVYIFIGTGGIEIFVIAMFIYAFAKFTSNGEFISDSERDELLKNNKRAKDEAIKRGTEKVSFTTVETKDEVIDNGHGVAYVDLTSGRELELMHIIDKVSEKMESWQKGAIDSMRTVAIQVGSALNCGKGVIINRTRAGKPKLVTAYHVIAEKWRNARVGDSVTIKINSRDVEIEKVKDPDLFKEDEDRAVGIELVGRDQKGADLVDPVTGEKAWIYVDGKWLTGKVKNYKGHIWHVSGPDVPFSASGTPVFAEGLLDKSPQVMGYVVARLKTGDGYIFHGARSVHTIGRHKLANVVDKVALAQYEKEEKENGDHLARQYAGEINKKLSDELDDVSSNMSSLVRQKLHDLVGHLKLSTVDDMLSWEPASKKKVDTTVKVHVKKARSGKERKISCDIAEADLEEPLRIRGFKFGL